MDQTLRTQVGLEPYLLSAESQYSPNQMGLTLSNLNSLLFGTDASSFDVPTYTGTKAPKGFTGELIQPPPGATSMRTPASSITLDAATGRPVPGGSPILNRFASTPGGMPSTGTLPMPAAANPYGTKTVTTAAQPGLVQLMSQMNSAQRAAQVNDIATLGPGATQAIQAANPQMAALMNTLNGQAQTELNSGSGLTPDEQRMMQQATRSSWAARGLDGTNASAADEVLRQYALGQQLLRQRQQFAQGVVGQDQSAYQDPMLAMLTANGGQTAAQAQGMLPGAMFNPESPFAGNIAAANQQMNALFADPSTLSKINQTTQTVGNVVGTVGQIAGGIAGI